jgi:hypothetical protein
MYDADRMVAKEQPMIAVHRLGVLTAALALIVGLSPRLAGQKADAAKTITGNVVDAACFMIHPPVANAASHEECGAACMKRGVPLAIAGDDGSLYFPADGNKQLSSLHGQHVKATGTVTEKKEPMELKMPVGNTNTMTVKVEGGYKVIAIDSVAKAAK